jgi:hypothetical protein
LAAVVVTDIDGIERPLSSKPPACIMLGGLDRGIRFLFAVSSADFSGSRSLGSPFDITSAQAMIPVSFGTFTRSMASALLVFAGRYRPGSMSA